MEQLGYRITYVDLDTEDMINSSDAAISKANFDGNFTNHRLVNSHDILKTANVLTEHMLKRIQAARLKAVTVDECFNEQPENWYRPSNGTPFEPPTSWTRFGAAETPETQPPGLSQYPRDQNTSSRQNQKLSTGVYAAIAVAAALVAIFVAGLVIVILRRRRQKGMAKTKENLTQPEGLEGNEKDFAELARDNEIIELPGDDRVVEMPNHELAEMPETNGVEELDSCPVKLRS
jgi:hypothetical protein